jgi:hypothetical protein
MKEVTRPGYMETGELPYRVYSDEQTSRRSYSQRLYNASLATAAAPVQASQEN